MATEIVMPRLSDSMEEGTVLQWFAQAGDPVTEGDPLVEVETDKASVTYEAEVTGTLLSVGPAAGESVAVGAVIAVIGLPGETPAAPATSGVRVQPSPTSSGVRVKPSPASSGARVKASPLARRIAAELGIDLSTLAGTGPSGRVIRADVERGAPAAAAAPAPGNGAGLAKGDADRRPLSRMQQTIARRMAESRATVPDFELRAEVDMSELVALREQLRTATEQLPSYNDFIVKAVALALREFPRVNGSYLDGELVQHGRVNVGIAVAADDALVVPTIFDADTRSVGAIAAVSRQLAAKVRDGSITPAELGGSTFSVSNLGMFGVDSFSAVINAPQAAILAVGSLRPRPVVIDDGSVVARHTVQLSLACDHRILYGADGARFLSRLRELLQSPLGLLL